MKQKNKKSKTASKKKITIHKRVCDFQSGIIDSVSVSPAQMWSLLMREIKRFRKHSRSNPIPVRVALCFFVTISLFGILGLSHSPRKVVLSKNDITNVNDIGNVVEKPSWFFFHPVWQNTEGWSMLPTQPQLRVGIDDRLAQMLEVSADPDGFVSADFQIPDFIRPRVAFWMLVQARYSDRVHIVHDRNDPGMIYGYIDYRPLYRELGLTRTLENRIAKVEREVLEQLKSQILVAVGASKEKESPDMDSSAIRSFLSQWGSLTPETAKERIQLIRTQTGQKNEFRSALQRSRALLPHIESVLKVNQMPTELGRIPFVESSFNAKAYSKVGAVGIWQFMPATAKELIHSSDQSKWVDPVWQTRGAARLLRNYRNVLPDWGTAITAYNSGVGRISRLLRQYKKDGIEGILSLPPEKGLGFAGQNFFAQFLAAVFVEAYRDHFFESELTNEEVTRVFKGSLQTKEKCDI